MHLEVCAALWFLLPRDRRQDRFAVRAAATDTVGAVLHAVGIPLTEVGDLDLSGRPVGVQDRVAPGTLRVHPVDRPQRTRESPPRFLLDVHLGGLARRLRLLGLDVAYETDAEDAALARRAATEGRVLLTLDRGLLHRSLVPEGALVRGTRTDEQLRDVLDRFAPPLRPWTRCVPCGAELRPVAAEQVAEDVEPGTRRTYADFARCTGCRRVYWRGAHSPGLETIVAEAEAAVARLAPHRAQDRDEEV